MMWMPLINCLQDNSRHWGIQWLWHQASGRRAIPYAIKEPLTACGVRACKNQSFRKSVFSSLPWVLFLGKIFLSFRDEKKLRGDIVLPSIDRGWNRTSLPLFIGFLGYATLCLKSYYNAVCGSQVAQGSNNNGATQKN